MNPEPRDTDPKAEQVLLEGFRAMPPWRKLQLVSSMWRTCRKLALAGLNERYPGASTSEIERRLAALLLGREATIRLFGWDPEVEGY